MILPAIAQSDTAPPLLPLPVKIISIDDLINQTVTKYHLNYQHFYATLNCESDGFGDISIQSSVPDSTGPNGRENSWGLAQIWLDPKGHPEVTKQEAIDPAFAIDFAGRLFASGQQHQFHCYAKEAARDWK